MRDVVVIGGGLSGLVAASELEKAGVDYTLIEVKRQLGGSLGSLEIAGSILDKGAFAFADNFDEAWLESLGFGENPFFSLREGVVAFKHGSGALIEALSNKITAPRLMRMAVSSIGELENGRYSICMENGLLLDAKNLIVALPARYTERLFYGYINPITEALLDYHYDTIQRISLVCKTSEVPDLVNPPDMAYVYIHRTENECRVPEGYSLLQFGLRITPLRLASPEQVKNFIINEFSLPEPIAAHVGYWAEADPISCYDDGFGERLAKIRNLLPDGVALIGSDYCLEAPNYQGLSRLRERIEQARVVGKAFSEKA